MSCRPTKKIYISYLTRLKLHGDWISNESELPLWFETDIFSIEPEVDQTSWLCNLHYQRSWKGAQRRGKLKEETEKYYAPVPIATHVHNILDSILVNNDVYINNHNTKFHMESMRTSLILPTTSREPSLNTRSFVLQRVRLMTLSSWDYGSAFVWNFSCKESGIG